MLSQSLVFGFFGLPGHLELLIIAGIILLLFGNRLPSVMRNMGRGIVEFKKGVHGVEDELNSVGKEGESGSKEEAKEKQEA